LQVTQKNVTYETPFNGKYIEKRTYRQSMGGVYQGLGGQALHEPTDVTVREK
jgi:hypothetical protein